MSIFARFHRLTLGSRPVPEAVAWKESPGNIPPRFIARIAGNSVFVVLRKNFGDFERISEETTMRFDADRDEIYAIDCTPRTLPWGVGELCYVSEGRRYKGRACGDYSFSITNHYDFLRWIDLQSVAMRTTEDVKKLLRSVLTPAVSAVLVKRFGNNSCQPDRQDLSEEMKQAVNSALRSTFGSCGIEIKNIIAISIESVAIDT